MTIIAKSLQELSQLPRSSQRAVGAVMGAIVADAATRPFHWVYKQDTIEEVVSSLSADDSLAFWPVSMSPFYNIPTGRRSCYNDECVCMLQSLPSQPMQSHSLDSYKQQLRTRYGPESDYAHALTKRRLRYDGSQRLTHKEPFEGPWQNQSVTTFLSTGEGEKSINESDGLCGAIPLIVWLAAGGGKHYEQGDNINVTDRESLFENSVLEAMKVLSASPASISHGLCAARLLHGMVAEGNHETPIEGGDLLTSTILNVQALYNGDEDIDTDMREKIQAVLDEESEGEEQFVASVTKFGKACAYPGNFQGSLLTVLNSTSFRDGVQKNIRAGGCNCGRANIAGALMGARWGVSVDGGRGIPVEWIERTEGGDELLALAVEKYRAAKLASV